MKIKRRILSLLLAVCLTVGVAPTTAFAADTTATSGANSNSGVSLAVALGAYDSSIWRATTNTQVNNSMRFLLGKKAEVGDKFFIAKLTDFGYSDSLYTYRDEATHRKVSQFSYAYKCELGTATTYKVGDTTYGTTVPTVFNISNNRNEFKTGVLSTEDFTLDELDACSFSFVPVGITADDGYYIFVTHTEKISNEYRDFTFSLRASEDIKFKDGESSTADDYALELKYEASIFSESSLKKNRTVWYIEKSTVGADYHYYVYAKAGGEKLCLTLGQQDEGLFLTTLIDGGNEGGTDSHLCLLGNLSTLTTKTEGSYAGYDAFRLVEDENVKNIVVKRQGRMTNETTGKTEIGVVKLPDSDNGNLVMWTESGPLYEYEEIWNTTLDNYVTWTKNKSAPYYRDFEDYTSGYSGTEAAYEKAHPALSPPTGYTEGQNVYQSEYKGKTFYAIRSFNMDYSVTGLASGNSLDVRMGTMEDDAPFASTMNVKSGTSVTEGNWVAFTLPTANQTGYKYTLESVSVTDSSGNEVGTDEAGYVKDNSNGKFYAKQLSGYRTGTLSSGATYVYFKIPSYAISVNISVKRESAPINNSAYGRFIISDNGLKYRSSVTANGLTPVKLFLSTDDLGEDGTSWFKIYEYPFNDYCTNNDDYLSYSIASCKWYMKIGEDGEYEPLNLGIGYERDSVGAHRATSAVTYLPLLSEETKVYYKCEYTIKRDKTGDVSDTKTLILTANVTNTGSLPQNTLYVCYQDNEDKGNNTYRSGQSYKPGYWLKFYASTSELYPKESEKIVIIDENTIGDAENDTISRFTYSFTWYIQAKDGSGSPVALNSTPVTVSPTSKDDLFKVYYAGALPNLTSQGQTEANVWFEVTKTDKTTGLSTTFKSSNTATLTLVADYPVNIFDYNQSMTASLEKDNIFVGADNLAKWEYSTNGGETWTDIPLTNMSDRYSDDVYYSAPFSIPLRFGHIGVNVYSFTVTTPGVYIFRMTNTAGSTNEVTCDFTKLHTHVWGEKTYYSKQGHVQKCTVAGCGAYNGMGAPHTLDEETGLCTICQKTVPATGISLNKSTLNISELDSETLTATVLPADTTDKVTWTSSDPKIATVDENGKVTALYYGTTTITATAGTKTATCVVNVACIHGEGTRYPTQESTCIKPGWDAYTVCGKCHAILDDEGNVLDGGIPYRKLADHVSADSWSSDETDHWKNCTVVGCGVQIDSTKAAHSSTDDNVATCQKKAVCDVCGTSYGDLADHSRTTEYTADETGHWYTCTTPGCTEKLDFAKHTPDHEGGATEEYPIKCTECKYVMEAQLEHTHKFTRQNTDALYKATDATCTKAATYYYSCTCGATGTETFEYGDSLGHSEGTEWLTDEDYHWHICTAEGCGVVVESSKGEHADTAVKDHKCDTCGKVLSTCADNDNDHLCDICGAKLSDHTGGEANCTSGEICSICKNEYGTKNPRNHTNLKHFGRNEATVNKEGNIEYWYCDGCKKYFSDEDGINEIKLEDTIIAKLSPTIIEEDEKSVTEGEKKELTFTFDTDIGDTVRAELDGKTLDAENYTTNPDGTVTLKPDYVATLSAGEHMLSIVSENGTATAKITVNEKAEENGTKEDSTEKNTDVTSPKTGDNSNIFLWLALLFVSGGTTAAMFVGRKKKRAK